jgi:hypothetical protein
MGGAGDQGGGRKGDEGGAVHDVLQSYAYGKGPRTVSAGLISFGLREPA